MRYFHPVIIGQTKHSECKNIENQWKATKRATMDNLIDNNLKEPSY